MREVACLVCGKRRRIAPSHLGDDKGKYCSIACFRNDKRGARVVRKCEFCGAAVEVLASKIKHGKGRFCSQSCAARASRTVHGACSENNNGTPTYKAWSSMRSRCGTPTNPSYRWYGGRGIGICDRWESYANFLADMGEKPAGMSLDRIDFNGNYEPENCRWATAFEQNQNRRNNIIVQYNGRQWCQTELARHLGLSIPTLRGRIKRGEPQEYWARPSCKGKVATGKSRSRKAAATS
jgi:hypothetical protein